MESTVQPISPFENYKKLCEEFQIAMTSVISKAGLSPTYYERLKDDGKIPPLEQVGPKNKVLDEDTSELKSIVQQTGIPARVLEPAIKYGVTAYMLQQIDELGLDDEEHACFLSELRIHKGEWAKWKEGIEPVPSDKLHDIAAYFAVSVDVLTSYTSLKKSIRDEIFRDYLILKKKEALKSMTQLALEMDEEAIIINHKGNIQIFSGNNDEMEKAIKKILKMELREFAEFIKTDEYKAEVEKRIDLKETKPY